MRRRVTAVGAFYESLATLDDSDETMQAVKALLLRVANHPEHGPALPGMEIRILKTGAYAGFAALRLFYWIDDENVHLLQIEPY